MKNCVFVAVSLVLASAVHAEPNSNLSVAAAAQANLPVPAAKGDRCAQGIQPIPVMTTDANGNAMFCSNVSTWEYVSQTYRASADQHSTPSN